MKKSNRIAGKIIYSIIFLILVPAILIFWAKLSTPIISYPAIRSEIAGWFLIVPGLILMLSAMFALFKFGKGLPMNAYPPPVFVDKHIFKIFKHPIYIGFSLFTIGFFILTGSASGLWLVSPILILCLIALVLGYEAIDLRNRFPEKKLKTLFDWPENNAKPISLKDYIFCFTWLIGLLLLHNYLSSHLFRTETSISILQLDFDNGFNAQIWMFVGLIIFIFLPFLIKGTDTLREWIISMMMAFGLSIFLSALYPELCSVVNKNPKNGNYLIPVFSVLISLTFINKSSRIRFLLILIPSLFLIYTQLVATQSPVNHILVSVVMFFISAFHQKIWVGLKNASERIANSWKEWTFGNIRIINHGFYVGFGAFLGILVAGILAGKEYSWAILLITIMVVVFSALWAQLIEGSEKLKRPYGYYGALVGVIFASLVIWALGFNVWLLIGVFSVVMPWVQAIGRLRCLINGCCHGDKTKNKNIGIRYNHYRSRVCGISNLKGELLHPTPLYSILWLFFIGFILIALWLNGFPYPFIFGLYLMLTGIGRFVEEAYRGEIQTPILWKLRLYQWTAILTIVIGIIMTIIPVNIVQINPSFSMEMVYSAIFGGLFTFFAMGVDFPYSDARFSRLV